MLLTVERLKHLAHKRGMTLGELGEQIGSNKNLISTWRVKEPSIESLMKIAAYLNVSIDYLVGLSDIENPYTNQSALQHPSLTHTIKGRKLTDKQANIIAAFIERLYTFSDESQTHNLNQTQIPNQNPNEVNQ